MNDVSKNIINQCFDCHFFYVKYVNAESLSIPNATIPSGYDRITTSDGTTCESSIASDMYVQTGLMGVKVNKDYSNGSSMYDSKKILKAKIILVYMLKLSFQ